MTETPFRLLCQINEISFDCHYHTVEDLAKAVLALAMSTAGDFELNLKTVCRHAIAKAANGEDGYENLNQ